jgi:hypothetical protein
MNNKEEHFLVADIKILEFYDKVQGFALQVNNAVLDKNKGRHPKPTAAGALWSISADIFTLHRSMLSLCSDGWAMACPIILRTMLELLMSITVITKKSDESEYFGFKYLYSAFKMMLNDSECSEEEKIHSRKAIQEGLKKLPDSIREKAKKFIFQQKPGAFWYAPEFASPTAIFEQGDQHDIKYLYKLLSGASHGGFLGLRYFKGFPDAIHPNPRADTRSQNFVFALSSRIMLESFYFIGKFGGVPLKQRYEELFKEFVSLKSDR